MGNLDMWSRSSTLNLPALFDACMLLNIALWLLTALRKQLLLQKVDAGRAQALSPQA